MATASVKMGASARNYKSDSKTIVAASAGKKRIDSLYVYWGDTETANNAWLVDYDRWRNGGINFSVNGQYLCQATYNGSNPRPTTQWVGTSYWYEFAANTALTVSFSSSDPNSNRAIHNQITVKLNYTVHPEVTAGNPIKNSDIAALVNYKNRTTNYTGPGVGVKIEPLSVIGTKNTTITASQYNNA